MWDLALGSVLNWITQKWITGSKINYWFFRGSDAETLTQHNV
jgi:hypothetical protein